MTDRAAATLADRAFQLVGQTPRRAQRLAAEAVALARRAHDPAAEATGWRAHGMAAQALGDFDTALSSLRTAIRRAEPGGAHQQAAEARASLAYVLMERGATEEALQQTDRAAAAVHGPPQGALLAQRALILQRCGRTTEAVSDYRRALSILTRAGDHIEEARLRNNRGLLYIDTGNLDAAEADLARAAQLEASLGRDVYAAFAQWNLGLVAGRRGDVPTALHRYDTAEATFRQHGVSAPELLIPHAELLLSIGMVAEARETAEQAVRDIAAAHMASHLPEALLLLAQAALMQRDTEAGRAAATRAARMFSRQKRPGWAAVARYMALRADERAGRLTPSLRSRALRVADELAGIGWRTQELDARLVAARVSLDRGDITTAERELRQAAAARRTGSIELRIRAWYAEALLRLATGRRAAAETALRAGFRVMERQRATLGATELRVHVAGHADDLASLGLDLARTSGSPAKVLEWAERFRAGTLGLRPARPPEDAPLASALAELRRASGEVETALLEGRRADALLARKSVAEDRVRRLARRTAAPLFGGQADPPALAEIAAGLGERALVELVRHRGTLLAVTVVDGTARLRELGPAEPVRRTLDGLLFGLRRLALGHGSDTSLRVARDGVTAYANRLAGVLLEPLRDRIDDRPLVVVPTGSLRSTPWSLLPGCQRRAVTVAPSAAIWLRAARLPPEQAREVGQAGEVGQVSPAAEVGAAGDAGAAGEVTDAGTGHVWSAGPGGAGRWADPGANGRSPRGAHRTGPTNGAHAVRAAPDGAYRVTLVCGPGLTGGAAEVAELAAAYPAATSLAGPAATVEATLRALDGADVAHVAAHGRLRGDNPLFSALELADGPLTVYDLERLAEAPRLVLLPSCQSGVGAELAGDEVMGLTSALFALGTRTAVATVIPVPDEATRQLMVALHAGLRRGRSTAVALADARAELNLDDPAALATAGGFVCYGAG